MKEQAKIRVELVDGTNTWVSVYPIEHNNLAGTLAATGEVFVDFISNLVVDENAVKEHLRPFEASKWREYAKQKRRELELVESALAKINE